MAKSVQKITSSSSRDIPFDKLCSARPMSGTSKRAARSIPAGGRRYRALALLVKQRRLAKTAPVPCVVRTDGLAEEDSLAENIQRAPLRPLY